MEDERSSLQLVFINQQQWKPYSTHTKQLDIVTKDAFISLLLSYMKQLQVTGTYMAIGICNQA